MNFQPFAEWLFYGVISGAAVYIAYLIKEMNESIQMLNVQIAIVLTKSDAMEKRQDKHDERLERLERLTS